MYVIGYTSEAPPAAAAEPAFAQYERIRRFAAEQGHQIVAVCSDVHAADGNRLRPGIRAALAIVESGTATTVVVASLETLAADILGQETVMAYLLLRGADIVSTEPADEKELADPPADAARSELRTTLRKIEDLRQTMGR